MTRLAATAGQLQRLIEALSPLGFVPGKIVFSPDGSIIVHGEGSEPLTGGDPLAEWEMKRATRAY